MDIVRQILEDEKRETEKYKSIEVKKHLEANVDLGYLLCSDPNDLDENQLRYSIHTNTHNFNRNHLFFFFFNVSMHRNDKEKYLSDLTRENVQLIVNSLWEQPTERVEECIVAKLPLPSFVLPRSRKCPVARPLTKWEQFALEKGIKKTKKDKKVFDDELDVSSLH